MCPAPRAALLIRGGLGDRLDEIIDMAAHLPVGDAVVVAHELNVHDRLHVLLGEVRHEIDTTALQPETVEWWDGGKIPRRAR